MSQVTRRAVTVTRHEYLVPSGCAYAELQKAISWALADMPTSRAEFEDACRVTARDDEIVVYWVEEHESNRERGQPDE